MSDYISRDATIRALRQMLEPRRPKTNLGIYVAIDVIDLLPAADVREVVRCADCKWFQCNMRQDGYLPKGVSEYECRYWCGAVDPIDFCSHWADMREEQT